MYEQVKKLAEEINPEIIAIRRDFHKYAEKGWFEMRTSSIIAGKLKSYGFEVLVGESVCDGESRMGLPSDGELEAHYEWAKANGADMNFLPSTKGGFTGVIGLLNCGPGPVTAMRFDIDALGVIENTDQDHVPAREGFSSIALNVMHACGHDGHAASGLGVAYVLSRLRNQLCGTIKLIFQPAEEGVRGAKSIVAKGHLDDVDFFLGSHISSMPEDEEADVIPGSFGSLATCKYDAYFYGKATHAGGSPEKGLNVIPAIATAILNLQGIPRHSKGSSRINVGRIEAGTGRNVIADNGKMEIEVRGETTEVNQFAEEYALRILESSAQMHGVTCEIKKMGSALSMSSDEALAKKVKEVCERLGDIRVSSTLMSKNSGSEDISYMMNRVLEHGGQAVFMRGLTTITGDAHERNFDFDESVLLNLVKIFSAVGCELQSKE